MALHVLAGKQHLSWPRVRWGHDYRAGGRDFVDAPCLFEVGLYSAGQNWHNSFVGKNTFGYCDIG